MAQSGYAAVGTEGLPEAPLIGGGPNFTTEWVSSSADGMRIYNAIFESTATQKSVVIFAHGFECHSHVEGMPTLLGPLLANGHTVWCYDKRGHGRTGRAAGCAPQFGDLGTPEDRMADLTSVVDAAHARFPNANFYIMGHSLGGAEVLTWMSLETGGKAKLMKGIVALAPMCQKAPVIVSVLGFFGHLIQKVKLDTGIGGALPLGAMTDDVGELGVFLDDEHIKNIFTKYDTDQDGFLERGEFEKVLNAGLQMDFDQDKIQKTFNAFDDKHNGKIEIASFLRHLKAHGGHDEFVLHQCSADSVATIGWYHGKMNAASITVPILLVHGVHDKVNPLSDALQFATGVSSNDITCHLSHHLKHGIFLDADGPKAVKGIVKWLNDQCETHS